MLELYDNPLSTSAQKVRLALAEKGLEYESHMMNLQAGDQFDPDFLKLNPDGVVPCLLHEGAVYNESTVICEYLDDAFPEPPLKPADAQGRARMRNWTVQTDSWLLTMINNLNVGIVFRAVHAKKTPEELEQFLSGYAGQPTKLIRTKELIAEGPDSPLVEHAIRRYHGLIGEIDAALVEGGPWLAGKTFSLADIGLLPYLNRLHDLGFERLWQDRPRYLDWYARMKARPSFDTAIGQVVDPKIIAFSQACVADAAPRLQSIMTAL